MAGYIKLYRQLVDWEWYRDTNTKVVFLHLLLCANYEDKRWQGIQINRGQFVTSYASLVADLKLSVRQIRTALSKLESTGEIVKKATNEYTIITVCKYDSYQEERQTSDKRATNERQTSDNNIRNKEYKEINNISSTSTIAADNEKFLHELSRTDTEFFASVCMRLKIDNVIYASLLKDFIEECKMRDKIHVSMTDAKTHFIDWSRGELERRNKPKTNESSKDKRRRSEVMATNAADYEGSF